MSTGFERYAIFWLPAAESRLARFGLDWTGWCAEAGERAPRRAIPGLPEGAISRELCRTGLHGLLGRPARPAEGPALWQLETRVAALADATAPIPIPAFVIDRVDAAIALVPGAPSAALDRLMAAASRALAGDDAGPGALATLRGFHLPLTAQLETAALRRAGAALTPVLAEALAETSAITEIALVGDPGHGRPLRVLSRFPLAATAGRSCSALEALGPVVHVPLTARTRGRSPAPAA